MKNPGIPILQYKRSSQAGFVLPIILIFIQIIMVYSLSAGLLNQQLIKEKSGAMITLRRDGNANAALLSIERNDDIAELPCVIPQISAVILRAKPIHWWLNKGCILRYKKSMYAYVVEELGEDNCGVMSDIVNHHADIANYYRMTLLDGLDDSRSTRRLIQITIAKPIDQLYQCYGRAHHVQTGRQMWRQL